MYEFDMLLCIGEMEKYMRKIFRQFSICAMFLTIVALCVSFFVYQEGKKRIMQSGLVSVNEVRQLIENNASQEEVNEALNEVEHTLQYSEKREKRSDAYLWIWGIYAVTILFLGVLYTYIYYTILRPFQKLKGYAGEIASGNFSQDLQYERGNYFGEFTWAFDSMRREIIKARTCEKEAIENNKVVIATISHDIKTPIASIRAYTEAMQCGMDYDKERRERYSEVIIRKCDEVTKLTNDLFLHSLSDLNKLKITLKENDVGVVLEEAIESLKGSSEIVVRDKICHAALNIDPQRMEQIVENIIANAKKYAPGSKIEISTQLTDREYICNIRDFGDGILPEDLPFVFHKFYRGKNVEKQDGAGLGLYIVKYLAEQMDGTVALKNDGGLVVTLRFCLSS